MLIMFEIVKHSNRRFHYCQTDLIEIYHLNKKILALESNKESQQGRI